MACIQHLRNLKCATEVEARAILDKIGEFQYSQKPATSFLSRCQLDLLAKDLIPDDAPANLLPVAVGADKTASIGSFLFFFCGARNCHQELRLRTVLELMLNKEYCISCCKEHADKGSMESGFSPSSCLTMYLSSVTPGKNFKYEITGVCMCA